MKIRAYGAALALSAFLLGACSTAPQQGGPGAGAPAPQASAAPAPPAGALTDISQDPQGAKTALLNTGVAAVPGDGAGYYMDQQEKKLRQALANSGASIKRVGDNIVLILPGAITFSADSGSIAQPFYERLNAVAQILKDFDKTIVNVTGHTDGQGSDQYNQGLSERRAGAVAQYLIGQGLVPQRFVVTGMGKTQPIATNNTPEGRQANRRVEIKLSPLTVS